MEENRVTCYFSAKTLELLDGTERRFFTFRFIIEQNNWFLDSRVSFYTGLNEKSWQTNCEQEHDTKTTGSFFTRNIPILIRCNIMSTMIPVYFILRIKMTGATLSISSSVKRKLLDEKRKRKRKITLLRCLTMLNKLFVFFS